MDAPDVTEIIEQTYYKEIITKYKCVSSLLPIIQKTAEPPPAIKNNGTDKNPAMAYN